MESFIFCAVILTLVNPFRTNISIILLLSSFLENIEINWDIKMKLVKESRWLRISFKNISFTHSAHCFISYRNQPFVLLCKSNNWFLYEMQHWDEMGENDRKWEIIWDVNLKTQTQRQRYWSFGTKYLGMNGV